MKRVVVFALALLPLFFSCEEEKEIETPQTEQQNKLSFEVNGVKFNMIRVEAGEFVMGAADNQEHEADTDEFPTHRVRLSEFFMGETEVTQELWETVLGENPSDFTDKENLPVENVSWLDCKRFISRLKELTGKNFRLPTEAEWEYAARGGNKSKGYKYAGSNEVSEVAWYMGNSGDRTHPVGEKLANELGLYDMSGNVCEWCSDWYGEYTALEQTDPQGVPMGEERVMRGYSYDVPAPAMRTSARDCEAPDWKYNNIGLRLVLSN